jgi:hypothetical protein
LSEKFHNYLIFGNINLEYRFYTHNKEMTKGVYQ